MICTFRFSGVRKLLFILFYVIFFFLFFSAHGYGYYSGRNTVNVYYGRYNNRRPLDVIMKFLQSEISQHISPQGGQILLPPNSDMHWLSDIFWVLILVNVWCSADCQLVLYSVEQLILKDVIFFLIFWFVLLHQRWFILHFWQSEFFLKTDHISETLMNWML